MFFSHDFEELRIFGRLWHLLHEKLHHIDLISTPYDQKNGPKYGARFSRIRNEQGPSRIRNEQGASRIRNEEGPSRIRNEEGPGGTLPQQD